jgi:hypothetical protein
MLEGPRLDSRRPDRRVDDCRCALLGKLGKQHHCKQWRQCTEFGGLPVIDTEEAESFTIAVKPEDIEQGDESKPEQHPIAIALRRQRGIDDARVSKREVLVRRGENGSAMARQSGCRSQGGTGLANVLTSLLRFSSIVLKYKHSDCRRKVFLLSHPLSTN